MKTTVEVGLLARYCTKREIEKIQKMYRNRNLFRYLFKGKLGA